MRLLLAAVLVAFVLPARAFTPDLTRLDDLPLHALPAQLVGKALAAKPQPLQFAVGVDFALTLADGRWDALPGGIARWRTRVFSAGAQSLNFEFAHAQLPAGASLWIYDAAGALVQGPYSAAQVGVDGKLWTAITRGEMAVLELRVPATRKTQVKLELAQAHHGFRSFDKAGPTGETAGACNVDVACPLGDAWRDPIRSVALVQIGGNFFCTGQLVNNVRQDNRPLFITANHCGIGDPAFGTAASVVLYWNFQSGTCNGASGPLNHTQNGSAELADDPNADFSLLQLSASPDPAFNVFFSGWDSSTTDTPACGVAIHHPSTDNKGISAENGATRTSVALDSGPTIQAWRVVWALGTTEHGSSGGGLWNQNRQLIGVLSGGDAACSSANPAVDNDQPDYFGRLDAGWTAQAASNHQLKAWLDPDNTGARTLCGKNPGSGCVTPAQVTCPLVDTGGGTSSGGGGGAMPGIALLLMAGCAALRRRRR